MKIQLPLENWADLLPFVPRHQLVELIKQLDDRQFVSILQFYLTKVGQITLGHLRIVAPRETFGPIVEVRKEMLPFRLRCYDRPLNDLETNLPEGPMPNNVKDFKLIELSYFDPSVANFLRQFQQEQQPENSLLNNVNLWFSSSITLRKNNPIMAILAQLMPMIGNINFMSMWHLHHMEFGRIGLGPNNAASQLLTTMLTDARILEIRGEMNTCMFSKCAWLNAPRNDGKPRALLLYNTFPNTTKNFIKRIKKDFSKATRPVSFFVHVQPFVCRNVNWQDICLDNGQTNERLMIKTIDPSDPNNFWKINFVLISRYPVGANQEWIEANEQEIMEWNFHEHNRLVHFEPSLGTECVKSNNNGFMRVKNNNNGFIQFMFEKMLIIYIFSIVIYRFVYQLR